jgi:hypothetical protein
MMFVPKGNGIFELKLNDSDAYIYDNSTGIVYYDFKKEGHVELDSDEIPVKVKVALKKIMM